MSGHKEGRDLRLPREPEDRGSFRSRRMSVKSYLPLPRATLLSPSKVSPRIPPLWGGLAAWGYDKSCSFKTEATKGTHFSSASGPDPAGMFESRAELSAGPLQTFTCGMPLRCVLGL